ncbi:MAG: helix-turn-helix transcriptional regulator [Gemmatimonadota bacterium]|nr:helix-turn-helix transcriptional regulator [Gemmatimonadota bacterium]
MYDVTAASIVRQVREGAQLSQRALAERANTTQAVVARIESGQSEPSLETLKRLAAAGGLDLACDLVPARASDPVVDAYKPGVDKTLLISNLRKSPQERLDDLIRAERTAAEFRRAGREARLRIAEAEAKYDAYRKQR